MRVLTMGELLRMTRKELCDLAAHNDRCRATCARLEDVKHSSHPAAKLKGSKGWKPFCKLLNIHKL